MSLHSEQFYIVVQCSPDCDPQFASRWLAAAVEADRILAHHRKANPDFERAIERSGLVNVAGFSSAAFAFISCWWLNNGPAFFFNLFDFEWCTAFAHLAGAGFFKRTEQHYQMTQPRALTSETITRALLQLAETEDEEHNLYPESLLTTMTEEEARRSVLMIQHRELTLRSIPSKEIFH